MIATHNIKVNGRWIHAGEVYEPEKVEKPAKKAPKPVKVEEPVKEPEKAVEMIPEAEVPAEEPVKEEKPRTNRRKANK